MDGESVLASGLLNVLLNSKVDFGVHFEPVALADATMLESLHHVDQGLKVGQLTLGVPALDEFGAFGLSHQADLSLFVMVAHLLFLHDAVGVARADRDHFSSEVHWQTEVDGCLQLEALLFSDTLPPPLGALIRDDRLRLDCCDLRGSPVLAARQHWALRFGRVGI